MDPLLSEDAPGGHDNLPLGTQVFSSTVRYGHTFWYLSMATCAIFTLFVIIGASVNGPARSGLIATAFVLLLSVTALLYWLGRRATATHARQLASGEWHEGVIVFASGDVVLRFMNLTGNVDTTIETRYLSRADVKQQFSPWRCSSRRHLQVYYLGMDTRPKVASISQDDLTDDVGTIAGYINDTKAKNFSGVDF